MYLTDIASYILTCFSEFYNFDFMSSIQLLQLDQQDEHTVML